LSTYFSKLSTIRGRHSKCRIIESMEYAQRTYSPDDEFGDMYVSLGVEGTDSKGEHMNLVETIKVLQKYV
jgi:hypothetical protein